MRKNMKKKTLIKYDPLTERIRELLGRVPHVGSYFARLYLWRAMMFNFMLVGATGLILSWILYEGLLRNLFVNLLGDFGTFIGMMVTTTAVFLWNYELNKKLSLNVTAQIRVMKVEKLMKLRDDVNRMLVEKKSDAKRSTI